VAEPAATLTTSRCGPLDVAHDPGLVHTVLVCRAAAAEVEQALVLERRAPHAGPHQQGQPISGHRDHVPAGPAVDPAEHVQPVGEIRRPYRTDPGQNQLGHQFGDVDLHQPLVRHQAVCGRSAGAHQARRPRLDPLSPYPGQQPADQLGLRLGVAAAPSQRAAHAGHAHLLRTAAEQPR
jgi:hypothetical protein